ncbi:MAG: hypothetical protein ACI91Q_001960, partial [Gammaproteobacteria bacterium]
LVGWNTMIGVGDETMTKKSAESPADRVGPG